MKNRGFLARRTTGCGRGLPVAPHNVMAAIGVVPSDVTTFEKWRAGGELIGLFSIVFSLIFVGLQLQQGQKIALSQAYQARAESSMALIFATLESDVTLSASTKRFLDEEDQLTPMESMSLGLLAGGQFIQWENVHYQYQMGFVTEEHMDTQLAEMRRQLPGWSFRLFYKNSPESWRSSFRESIEQIYKKIDG